MRNDISIEMLYESMIERNRNYVDKKPGRHDYRETSEKFDQNKVESIIMTRLAQDVDTNDSAAFERYVQEPAEFIISRLKTAEIADIPNIIWDGLYTLQAEIVQDHGGENQGANYDFEKYIHERYVALAGKLEPMLGVSFD